MNTSTDVLHVVIDERKRLDRLEDLSFIRLYSRNARHFSSTQRVFKDYILSSEVYEIPS